MGTTGTAHKVPMQLLALLLTRSEEGEGGGARENEDSDEKSNRDSISDEKVSQEFEKKVGP